MATTVTYKGQTLATVDNQTKTLQTAGTWVEDDFTLVDVSGGGSDTLTALLTNTLEEYSSGDVTALNQYQFENNTGLKTVSLPNVTSAGRSIFSHCTNLESASFPGLTVLPQYMFEYCTNLSEFDFSNILTLNNQGVFRYSGLEGVWMPKANSHAGAFTGDQFAYCTSLVYFRSPYNNGGSLRSGVFAGCTSLKLIDLGVANTLSTAGNCFTDCTNLEILILRKTTGISAISRNTDFQGVSNKIKVYVPSALISTYQTATNWSTYYANDQVEFLALEGSPYEDTDFVYMGVPA